MSRLGVGLVIAVLFAFSAVCLWEAVLRWVVRRDPSRGRVEEIINRRLWDLWSVERQPNPLFPPFLVFANTGLGNASRLRRIAQSAGLPPNVTWAGGDFLQAPERYKDSWFVVHTNSLGFRDPPRKVAKTARTYRIICLGDYETFGQGVADHETFPRRLEEKLNQLGRRRFEVWNGGRQASTAIMGLARLKLEIAKYEPDMLILQFGSVDLKIKEDRSTLHSIFQGYGKPYLSSLPWLSTILSRSFVFRRIMNFAQRMQERSHKQRWFEATRRMLDIAKAKKLPVILLDRPRQDTVEELQLLERIYPNVIYVSMHGVFHRFPPTHEDWQKFLASDNWAREFFGANLGEGKPWPYLPYHVDIFQLSAKGHEVLARGLLPAVRRLMKMSRLKQRRQKFSAQSRARTP